MTSLQHTKQYFAALAEIAARYPLIGEANRTPKIPSSSIVLGAKVICAGQDLRSLKKQPLILTGPFDCSRNKLTSLLGSPWSVSRDFWAHFNEITSLVGGPTFVGGTFEITNNRLTTLACAPKHMTYLQAENNQIESLEGIHKTIFYARFLNLKNNPIKRNVLGVLLIDGLERVFLDDPIVQAVLNAYIENTTLTKQQKVIRAQRDLLIEYGKDDFAAL